VSDTRSGRRRPSKAASFAAALLAACLAALFLTGCPHPPDPPAYETAGARISAKIDEVIGLFKSDNEDSGASCRLFTKIATSGITHADSIEELLFGEVGPVESSQEELERRIEELDDTVEEESHGQSKRFLQRAAASACD
jgi:hypothetical protein